jgi:hypothetical protein
MRPFPTTWRTGAVIALAVALGGCAGRCGARGGLPPPRLPLLTGADGQKYLLLDKGPYKAFYDRWGRLQRLEYDSNGDGKPDQVALHDGQKVPHQIEVDQDFDGRPDRWERYDSAGTLVKVGSASTGAGPDQWRSASTDGSLARIEYDQDGDGRIERAETLKQGLLVSAEMDSDRDGRMDRWQTIAGGRLVMEELDTDADGAPDRRIRYDAAGRVAALEPSKPR